jgi:hypothetical protein
VSEERVRRWLADLEARHLRDLGFAEVRRALQALSSLYVQRRKRLDAGAALEGAGKRAAFALFYGPLHFLAVREVVRALDAAQPRPERILDLGCGTGVGGAAWALEAGGRPVVEGIDRNGWAVDEARWTLRRLDLIGDARRGAAESARTIDAGAVLAAFTLNELDERGRERVLQGMLSGAASGISALVVEPIAARMSPWWPGWARRFVEAGGRADEWRFRVELPDVVRRLDRAAGLDHSQLGARSLWLRGRKGRSRT